MPERGEDVVRIRAAIRKPPLPFQEILMLREFEELSSQT
jgi:DNA-directed RNA polymerase specialized sigma24 family protein